MPKGTSYRYAPVVKVDNSLSRQGVASRAHRMVVLSVHTPESVKNQAEREFANPSSDLQNPAISLEMRALWQLRHKRQASVITFVSQVKVADQYSCPLGLDLRGC
eukprot:614470-Amphidinium_carterae.1